MVPGFCELTGADGYAQDTQKAVELARKVVITARNAISPLWVKAATAFMCGRGLAK